MEGNIGLEPHPKVVLNGNIARNVVRRQSSIGRGGELGPPESIASEGYWGHATASLGTTDNWWKARGQLVAPRGFKNKEKVQVQQ